jgi:hypothetical protein
VARREFVGNSARLRPNTDEQVIRECVSENFITNKTNAKDVFSSVRAFCQFHVRFQSIDLLRISLSEGRGWEGSAVCWLPLRALLGESKIDKRLIAELFLMKKVEE